MQLQATNEMMKSSFDTDPVSSVLIFGVVGGNGLEYMQNSRYDYRKLIEHIWQNDGARLATTMVRNGYLVL